MRRARLPSASGSWGRRSRASRGSQSRSAHTTTVMGRHRCGAGYAGAAVKHTSTVHMDDSSAPTAARDSLRSFALTASSVTLIRLLAGCGCSACSAGSAEAGMQLRSVASATTAARLRVRGGRFFTPAQKAANITATHCRGNRHPAYASFGPLFTCGAPGKVDIPAALAAGTGPRTSPCSFSCCWPGCATLNNLLQPGTACSSPSRLCACWSVCCWCSAASGRV